MRFKRFNKIFTLFLLLYFVGFAVSPVSAIFPADQLDNDVQSDVFKKSTTQADLFFFDLALWEVLKTTKRSDRPASVAVAEKSDAHAKDIHAKACDNASDGIDSLTLHIEASRFYSVSSSITDKTLRLAHSGLSPPFFS